MPYHTEAEVNEAYSTLLHTFSTGLTKNLAWRKWQLKQVWWMLEDNEEAIFEALRTDLNRHDFESYSGDLAGIKQDVLKHITNLEKWAADSYPDAGFLFGRLGKARIRKEPLGVALIIGAWNFPFLLLLQPMIAAIAAGNCVMLKPSELACASQKILEKIVPQYLDSYAIRLITAGPKETTKLLERKFNHIFFTGSNTVAKHVAAAAAKHLTPVVLELGGQGPAIVTRTANVDLAAKRIAFVKWVNAGQICLTVNHVFAEAEIYDELVQRMCYWFSVYSAEERYCKIVNDRNFDRLVDLLGDTSGKVVYGGKTERSRGYFEPTIVTNVDMSDSLLSAELFGPIVPVIKTDFASAYRIVNAMDNPLALYIFSQDQTEVDEILNNTNSGGVTVNDVIMHVTVPNAPFGGVGGSGYGAYHGRYGFDAFTHHRSVVALPNWLDKMLAFRYPPYLKEDLNKIRVHNNLGFKKGEGMADQKVRKLRRAC